MRMWQKVTASLLFTAVSVPAQAAGFFFDFSSPTVSGSVTLTYSSAGHVTGIIPGTESPNTVDPIGSYVVTGATGVITNTTLGLSTAITGVVPSNPADPHDTNLLAPASFGHFIVAAGVPGPEGVAPGFSYTNLFYPGGSPQTASDYPGAGGFLDIYGLVFTTADGVFVNFWSIGDFGSGASYGAGFTDGRSVLDYTFDTISVTRSGAVPEPASWAMMLGGFGIIGGAMRARRKAVISLS